MIKQQEKTMIMYRKESTNPIEVMLSQVEVLKRSGWTTEIPKKEVVAKPAVLAKAKNTMATK